MTRFSRFVVCALLLVAAGCGSKSSNSDGGNLATCVADGGARKPNGQVCGCNADCQSTFCVDGVCCNSACTETCKTCNDQSAPGICSFAANGVQEQSTACMASPASTCGLDGTCDGQGHCRKHPAGTTCKSGTCDGASITNVNVCDGQGHCKSGPATICAPFNCDSATNACATTCKSSSDCANGVLCVNGSCGPKPNGAVCDKPSECGSGFCTDKVCCNVACEAGCISCRQAGRVGTCWPVDVGAPDPHGVCLIETAATCGNTGACNGIGGCALYAAEIVCTAPSCTGDRLNTAGTCNGQGSCRPPGAQNCSPFRCADGACLSRCDSDADCVSGHACVNGSCGPKAIGQPCSSAADCASTHCIENVCCDQTCGPCRSCALSSSRGHCTYVPAGGSDPQMTCVDQTAASCGTDGKCDGAGSCRRYKSGTVCAPERCQNTVFTPEATCNSTGDCVAPNTVTCVPFACNGSQCFGACTSDANCSPGNVCVGNSCGKKPNGAFCSNGAECTSGSCAQGICCATACAGACRSCALSGTMGICTNVPSGFPDPSQICVERDSSTCDTNGKCEAGACQKYVLGTPCAGASCPTGTTTLTRESRCDGAGTCITPAATSCFPFACGAAVCNSACFADGDCAPPAACYAGSCGLKPNGASCGGYASECASGICAQGVCCATPCVGTCLSCAIGGSEGTCSTVPLGGVDPKGQCADQGQASCGMTGFCDGSGACQRYAAGTQCDGQSCPLGTATTTLARTCDGSGTCRPAATLSCGSYACNGTTCNAACGTDADCAPGNICTAGSCGKKRLGQLCAAGSECDSNSCVDGVCCGSAVCGTCQSCNVPGQAGLCSPVLAGEMEPHNGCPPSPPCGYNGTCNGNGACRSAPVGTSCGAATCSGSNFIPVGMCDGAGACTRIAASCAPYVCAAGACATTCASAADCTAGFTCMSGSCTNLKPKGAGCTAGTECASSICADGVCCATACAAACYSCNVAADLGTCLPVMMGVDDPHHLCAVQSAMSCGTTGRCNGAGACSKYPAGTVCGGPSCMPNGSARGAQTCNGNGTCTPGALQDCMPYVCDSVSGTCPTSCSAPSGCANRFTCVGTICQPV